MSISPQRGFPTWREPQQRKEGAWSQRSLAKLWLRASPGSISVSVVSLEGVTRTGSLPQHGCGGPEAVSGGQALWQE